MNAGALRASALAMLVLIAGCAPVRTGDADRASYALPDSAPSIRGEITAREGGDHIRIEVEPDAASGSDKAAVALTASTRIMYRDGRPASASDLAVGRTVSAWFTGAVRESYPVQADAATVVIEP